MVYSEISAFTDSGNIVIVLNLCPGGYAGAIVLLALTVK